MAGFLELSEGELDVGQARAEGNGIVVVDCFACDDCPCAVRAVEGGGMDGGLRAVFGDGCLHVEAALDVLEDFNSVACGGACG